MISVRKVNADDCEELLHLGKSTFFDTFAAYNTKEDMESYMSENYTISKIRSEICDPANCFLFAIENNKAVGFVKLRTGKIPPELVDTNPIEIERIYVSKSHQGKKVGALLMSYCINLAKEEKHDCIWLAVWEHNLKAQEFYTKWGFEKFGSQIFVLGNDKQNDFLLERKVVF